MKITNVKREYIVTVKLPKNKAHNPRAKVTGVCPAGRGFAEETCTDVTGEHHTLIVWSFYDLETVTAWATSQFGHVTRVEVPQAYTLGTNDVVELMSARLDALKARETLLNALEAVGVDNWPGYSEARELMDRWAAEKSAAYEEAEEA